MAFKSPNTIIQLLRSVLVRLEREAKLKPNDATLFEAQRSLIRMLAELELRHSKAA